MKAKPQFESKRWVELIGEQIHVLAESIRCREKYIKTSENKVAKGTPLAAV